MRRLCKRHSLKLCCQSKGEKMAKKRIFIKHKNREAAMKSFLFLFWFGIVSANMVFATGGGQPAPSAPYTPSEPQQAQSAAQNNATAYYVSAAGDNNNDGLSESSPFKMLRKALSEMETNRNIRTVIVIGTLDDYSEGTGANNNLGVFSVACRAGLTNVTIKGKDDDAVLMSTVTKSVITVMGVNVRFENITITGGNGLAGGGIIVAAGSYREQLKFTADGDIIRGSDKVHWFDASVTLGPGAVVTGNRSQSNGGGISVGPMNEADKEFKGASVRIEGGIIENNEAAQLGGGIFLLENAGFSMTSGEIRNNTAVQGGGLFFAFSDSKNAIDGGSISGNRATGLRNDSLGGGVFILSGTLTMNDGSITENSADTGGGGVTVFERATFRLTSGSITKNEAIVYGGGIFIAANATASMRDGSLSENSTLGNGGGAAIANQGTFTVQGGSITGNQVNDYAGRGGGVYVSRSGTLRQTGGQISGNTSLNDSDPDIYRE
jgi:hypothetical protein